GDARRQKRRSKSSADGAKATPRCGKSSSSARCCAGDIRPWRRTKVRTGRTCGGAALVICVASRSIDAAPARIGQSSLERCGGGASRGGVLDHDGARTFPRDAGVIPRRAGLPKELL